MFQHLNWNFKKNEKGTKHLVEFVYNNLDMNKKMLCKRIFSY